MAGSTGPNIVNNGLILNLDAANIKSFKGLSGTNLWYNLNRTFSPTNTSTFKVSYGTEQSYIPYFNGLVNTTYCDIYNDYAGGSGQCCPSPFYYHGPNVTVNGSTQYTYQIIFKTTNGYYSTNYMYRYEFGTSGLLTEQGVVDASRLESLGNGWYHAWGQFTTNASTTNMTGWLFHYEYLVTNRISVAAVSLTQGSTIHRPEHLINLGFRETRGATVATGGGWKDLSTNSYNGELVNGASYVSTNRGGIVFDGSNDYISTSFDLSWNHTNSVTIFLFLKPTSLSTHNPFIGKGPSNWEWQLIQDTTSLGFVYWNTGGGHTNGPTVSIPNFFTSTTQFVNICMVWNHVDNKYYFYKNASLIDTITWVDASINQNRTDGINIGGNLYTWGTNGPFWSGTISNIQIYNRALSSTEIVQNYNSQKSRFGL